MTEAGAFASDEVEPRSYELDLRPRIQPEPARAREPVWLELAIEVANGFGRAIESFRNLRDGRQSRTELSGDCRDLGLRALGHASAMVFAFPILGRTVNCRSLKFVPDFRRVLRRRVRCPRPLRIAHVMAARLGAEQLDDRLAQLGIGGNALDLADRFLK